MNRQRGSQDDRNGDAPRGLAELSDRVAAALERLAGALSRLLTQVGVRERPAPPGRLWQDLRQRQTADRDDTQALRRVEERLTTVRRRNRLSPEARRDEATGEEAQQAQDAAIRRRGRAAGRIRQVNRERAGQGLAPLPITRAGREALEEVDLTRQQRVLQRRQEQRQRAARRVVVTAGAVTAPAARPERRSGAAGGSPVGAVAELRRRLATAEARLAALSQPTPPPAAPGVQAPPSAAIAGTALGNRGPVPAMPGPELTAGAGAALTAAAQGQQAAAAEAKTTEEAATREHLAPTEERPPAALDDEARALLRRIEANTRRHWAE